MKTRFNKGIVIVISLVLVIFLITRWGVGADLTIPADVQTAMSALNEPLDYNIHVKKILSDKCFSCHGPDAKKQKGDLRLDLAEAAYSKETESGRKAIRAGSMARSEVAHRILSGDKEYMMPTPASHLSLTTEEKAILLTWIDQGAKYAPHWAFVAPKKAALPEVEEKKWVVNDIDRFVLNRLEKEGLQPSPQADKETLIRRVSFDLTGLPPTVAEIDAFLQDASTNAYEKMVDQFLQSPRYGERMAAYWLDVARFADSHGYLDDKHRDASPWRDWVINAYNKNLPYDQFITWQLAGDLMPHAAKEQILATGFNRNHKQNSEAGIIPEEFRVEYVVDRTNTVGASLMGLTVGCAKCHDHKYDPISQKDYYSLFAFFNSTFELGSSNYGAGNNIVPGPTLLLLDQEKEQKLASLNALIKNLTAKKAVTVAAPEISLQQKVIAALSFDKTETIKTYTDKGAKVLPAVRNAVQSLYSAPASAEKYTKGVAGNALQLEEGTLVHLPAYQLGYFERYDPFSFSIWVRLPKKYDDVAILHQSDPRRYGFQGYDLVLKDNKVNFRLMHAYPHDAISVVTSETLDSNKWYNIAVSYDGSSSATGVSIYLNGKAAPVQTEYDNLKKNIKPFPNIHKVVAFNGVSFGARELERTMKGGELDEFFLFDDVLNAQEAAYLHDKVAIPFAARKPAAATKKADSIQLARVEEANIYDSTQEVMVMGDLPQPRKTHVLLRGVYDSYGDEVKPSTPAAILPYPKALPQNRLGLAEWLFLPQHPLTARIAVNRIWEMYFGRGLVKTSDDFGNQGEMPSHPALLDYLAVTYREQGWNTKQLQKLILMSATYRQQSVLTPELLAKDPQNILLARGARYKMPAEMIRDNALAISGLLSAKVGGPSVYPYQPPGLWEALSDKSWKYLYKESEGEDLFRRSIYTVVKRSSPPPFMLIFDAPDRNFCTVKRTVSSSPLQALALMNDPTFIESSKYIAGHMMQEGGAAVTAQLAYGFRLVTGRKPDNKEAELLNSMYTQENELYVKNPGKAIKILAVGHANVPVKLEGIAKAAAYVDVVMALLNTDEFITRK
jgi:cytochrome c553